MSKSRVSLGLFLLLSLFAAQCFGEIKPREFYLSPYIGGYTFDGTQHLETRPVYGIRLGYNYTGNLGIEALFDYTWTNLTKGAFVGGDRSAKSYGYGVDALYHFMPDRRLVPFVAAGLRGISVDYPQGQKDQHTAAFDYGGGLEYALTEAVSVRGDIRHLILMDHGRSNLEYTVGLSYFFGGAAAPPAPVSPPPAPEANLMASPGSIIAGGEAGLTWSSRNASNCEIRPGVGPVAPQGSAQVTPTADTVYTLICNGPGGAASSQAAVKVAAPPPPAPAPVVVPPPAPEVKPEPAPIPKEMLCYTMNIEFATGKADIRPEYHNELVKLADFMKAYPTVKGVIEGHTDNRGGKEYNNRLSERRAASVVAYLVKLGIDKSRLGTKGFGYGQPIADNKTAEGRQKNRRIVANFDCVEKH